jgi:N-acetylglucosaminyldiphosphoundecaprenol N-acetyl-beta-D-mannosaminyltransferase
MENTIKILGTRVDNLSITEIEEKILNILNGSSEQKFVTTLNPEILLKAHWDEKYRNILNSADLNICDGFGIKLISFLRGNVVKSRLTGADFVDFLLREAKDRKLKVLIVTAENSLSAPGEIEEAVKKKYSNLSIKSHYFSISQNRFENGIMNQAEIVFVNFGAPEQEKFIFENRAKFPAAKVLVGVGGTFDFLTGKIRRAPSFLRAIGLEWFWRFLQEPKRLHRILNAVIVFPWKALFGKN